jgi:hypothetical protein
MEVVRGSGGVLMPSIFLEGMDNPDIIGIASKGQDYFQHAGA